MTKAVVLTLTSSGAYCEIDLLSSGSVCKIDCQEFDGSHGGVASCKQVGLTRTWHIKPGQEGMKAKPSGLEAPK